MTDNLFPFVADGLIDGGVAADAAPPDLRAAVDLLRAAGQPGSVEEVSTMATLVQQFTAEVNAAASTSTHASTDSLRSNSMISTRVTRRALSIVAITLLAAGTAAAAAGGALPVFEGVADEVVVEDDASETAVLDDGSDDEVTDSSVGRENHNGTVDHHGKCTAWTHGAAKSATNPSFAELQVSADAAGLSIDDYCATVLEATGSGDDATSDDDEADDESDDEADDESDDEADDDSGNSGHGNGNSGHGNDESDD